MAVTLSASNFIRGYTATAASRVLELPTDVPAGAVIVVGVHFRNSNVITADSISDPVNGTWSSPFVQGPFDNTEGDTDIRTYVGLLENSAALTGSSNRTITITFSASVNQISFVGWISADGALEFDAAATAKEYTSLVTSLTTNNVTATGAGVLIGFAAFENNESANPTYSTGDSSLASYQADGGYDRCIPFGRTIGAAGTYNTAFTVPDSNYGNLHLIAIKEASGSASAPKRSLLLGIG